ncbi:TetR family transcriptional regulator [Actinoallomurus rhizosphaericola]|uniref:TetR family transcriptional regulator n=1 Tax=Actinoallomurus rhizosphaericola TaxID=2952536 RepID=UPI002093DCE4|nr:TetR family transcriptional regulator [Actinoallomurus rhizosphaericola]MCO6000215.1 TetR/AcrR family transcriptional regulator [Actinoallomurus rhizosphaericola]
MSATPDQKLWARTRQAVHAEVARTAMGLFLERGFEATTIDDIAAAAGISRRSFFRYFGTKEDIVLGDLAAQGELIRKELEARPATEDAWTALLNALRHAPRPGQDDATTLKISKMLYGTPSLRARSLEKHLQWQALLTPDIRRRLGVAPDDEHDLRADAIVACVLTCLDVAGEAWTRSDGTTPLDDLVLAAVAAVRGSAAAY